MATNRYVTMREAARLLGVDLGTLYRMVRTGVLSAEKRGRERYVFQLTHLRALMSQTSLLAEAQAQAAVAQADAIQEEREGEGPTAPDALPAPPSDGGPLAEVGADAQPASEGPPPAPALPSQAMVHVGRSAEGPPPDALPPPSSWEGTQDAEWEYKRGPALLGAPEGPPEATGPHEAAAPPEGPPAAVGGGGAAPAIAAAAPGGDGLDLGQPHKGEMGAGTTAMVTCPSCGGALAVRKAMAGMLMRCPKCSGTFTVMPPDAPEWEAAAAVERAWMDSPSWGATAEGPPPEYAVQPPTQEEIDRAEWLNTGARRAAEEANAQNAVEVAENAAVRARSATGPPMDDEAFRAASDARRRSAVLGRLDELQGRETALSGQLDDRRKARGRRNQSRKQGAQQRLLGRAMGPGNMGMARDIVDAIGLSADAPDRSERQTVEELRQLRALLEQIAREALSDGNSYAERNMGEPHSGAGSARRSKIVNEGHPYQAQPASPARQGPQPQGIPPGGLRPANPVPGARAAQGGQVAPSLTGRLLSMLPRLFGS